MGGALRLLRLHHFAQEGNLAKFVLQGDATRGQSLAGSQMGVVGVEMGTGTQKLNPVAEAPSTLAVPQQTRTS